ncbi:hypothetical protein GCM10023093_31230 [Nemorincola caseinilytica]|uniref:Uncharacterized protein n=2 Tax=Nemorincola caseinilytica TaxID=2054315 RepID=A0ABP8NRM7_9BACT
MMHKLLGTLQRKDTAAFYELFPTFDTLWGMVIHNSDKDTETQKVLNKLKERPQVLIEFDPLYNRTIVGGFAHVLAKGEDSGVNWNSIVMARYELYKSEPTKDLIGYDRVVPERFHGFMFINDAYARTTYGIRVAEVQKIKDHFFGGQVLNILPARTADEFNAKEQMEQDYYAWLAAHPDTVLTDTTTARADSAASDTTEADPLKLSAIEEEEDGRVRREVIERRYYEGTLDNEIPIVLYIRYLKTPPGKAQLYDGVYKLGENKRYLRLEITKNADGKWIIEDESAVGTMELTMNGRTYTGTWSNAEDNGYDVVLTQTGSQQSKIETLDKIIDQKLSGKIDESKFEKEKEAEKEKEEKEAKKKKEEEERLEREKEKQKRKEEKRKRRAKKETTENESKKEEGKQAEGDKKKEDNNKKDKEKEDDKEAE